MISFTVLVFTSISPYLFLLIKAFLVNQKDKTKFTPDFWKELPYNTKGQKAFIIFAIYDVLGTFIGVSALLPDILYNYPLIAVLIHITAWALFLCGANIYFKKLLKIQEEMNKEGVEEVTSH